MHKFNEKYKHLNEIDKLSSRLYYGVKKDLLPLVTGVKRLGRQRARKVVDIFGNDTMKIIEVNI